MKSYDPSEVTVTFNGVTIQDFGPGTFVKCTRNNDGWSLQMGNSGTGARSRNPDKSGKMELTLLVSGASNALLEAFVQTDELSANGIGEFLVKDRTTGIGQCTAQNAWISKRPDWERAKEVGEVTWTLETDNLDIVHDGVVDVPVT